METNKKAMTLLKNNKFDLCYQTLMKAEKLLNAYEQENDDFVANDHYNTAASVTFNNIGCYYQK